MIDALGSIVSKVSDHFEINQSTLSGCIDVLVVDQGDGLYKSSPFHVRFGKLKLLQSNQKEITIEVNDVKADFKMKLDRSGEAFFEILVPVEDERKSRSQQLLKKTTDESFLSDMEDYRSENASPELQRVSTISTKDATSNESTMKSKGEQEQLDFMKIQQTIEKEVPEESKKPETKKTEEKTEPMSADMSKRGKLSHKSLNWLLEKLPTEKHKHNHDTEEKCDETELIRNTVIVKETVLENHHLIRSAKEHLKKTKSLSETQGEITVVWGPKDKVPVSEMTMSKLLSSTITHEDEPGSSDEEADDRPTNELKMKNPFEEEATKMKLKKTYRPTSEMLKSLKLQPGLNKIKYSVQSKFRGEQSLTGHIYLVPPDTKIVISDIDGTITRSDFLGQLVPMFGRDWSHDGVSELFYNIYKNRYFMLYLSARPIGQAAQTRNYLTKLAQKDFTLPPGPVIMSPDRFFPSFKREVIDRKPEIFKIACLKGIKRLFPVGNNPFHAGFGNRETDAISYRAVGIEMQRIFCINSKSQIQQLTNPHKLTYSGIHKIIHDIFPPLKTNEAVNENTEAKVLDNDVAK